MLNSLVSIAGTLGTLLLNYISEWAYKTYSSSTPMLVVTITDLVLMLVMFLLFSFTSFGKTSIREHEEEPEDFGSMKLAK